MWQRLDPGRSFCPKRHGLSSKMTMLCIALFLCFSALAQTSDLEFANFYYDNGEFEKSALYYEKLLDKTSNPHYYQRLLSCYMGVDRYDSAEELIKKQIRRAPLKSEVYVDLAQLYAKLGNSKKKEKALEEVLDNIEPSRNSITLVARKLQDIGEFETAEELYMKGISLLQGDYNFALELADIYGAKGNMPKMIEAYIELVGANPSYVPSVQNMLNRYLNLTEEPEKADLVKNVLLKAIQRQPENNTYNEMLIWLFYQIKNFNAAFVQLKALDKRFNETGSRILDFADLCLRNNDYQVANNAYKYLQESGKDAYITELSQVGMARTEFLLLENTPKPEKDQIMKTGMTLDVCLKTHGIDNNTIDLALDFSQFLVKYDNRLDSAIQFLTTISELVSIAPKKTAEVKLALGDLLMIKGEIWDASLFYSQVEKSFKEDILGAEAKFRNAKISYYTGDFDWAQDQLDVLKASTSKLISNDAMNLSILITDNMGLDSITEPLEMFAQADLYNYRNLLDEAEERLDSLSFYYPGHRLADEILFEKAEIQLKRKDFAKAARFLEKLIELYPMDILGDDAVFLLAEINKKYLDDKTKAAGLYQKIITEYPSSLFVVEARKQFRELRGDSLN